MNIGCLHPQIIQLLKIYQYIVYTLWADAPSAELTLYSSQYSCLGASNVRLAKVQKWIRRHDSWKSHLVQEKPSVRISNMLEIQFGDVISANVMWKWCVRIFLVVLMVILYVWHVSASVQYSSFSWSDSEYIQQTEEQTSINGHPTLCEDPEAWHAWPKKVSFHLTWYVVFPWQEMPGVQGAISLTPAQED